MYVVLLLMHRLRLAAPNRPQLLWKSASLVGFFLPQYAAHFRRHLSHLCALLARRGTLRAPTIP